MRANRGFSFYLRTNNLPLKRLLHCPAYKLANLVLLILFKKATFTSQVLSSSIVLE